MEDPRPLGDRLAMADRWYRLTREQMLEENRAQMEAPRKVGKHPALGAPYKPPYGVSPGYAALRDMTDNFTRPLPPLEMACHDAGRNIPREFGLAIQRALVFFGLIALLLTVLFFVSGYHFVKTPTEDQLYGCTWENQDAETGACK